MPALTCLYAGQQPRRFPSRHQHLIRYRYLVRARVPRFPLALVALGRAGLASAQLLPLHPRARRFGHAVSRMRHTGKGSRPAFASLIQARSL